MVNRTFQVEAKISTRQLYNRLLREARFEHVIVWEALLGEAPPLLSHIDLISYYGYTSELISH